MATLEEKLMEQLRPQVDQLGNLQRQELGRTALSVPAAVAAGRRGGPMAAFQMAQQFHPQRPGGPSELDVVNAKQSLLGDMAAFMESKNDDTVDVLDKISKMQKANEGMLDIFKQYVSGNQQASTALAQARVGLAGNLAGKYADTIRDRVTGQLSEGSGRASAAYAKSRDLLFGGPNPQGAIMGPEAVINAANNILYSGLGAEDKAQAWAALQAEAAQRGGASGSLRAMLEMASNSGLGEAAQILQELNGIQSQVNSIEANALSKVQAMNGEAFKEALQQHGGMSMGQIVKAFEQFRGIFDPNAGAESMQAVMDSVFDELKPPEDQPDLMANYQNLLDGIDDDGIDPASSFSEARRRILSSPEFKQLMETKGLQSPGAALKWMRKEIREKRRAERQHDARLLRDERVGIKQPDSADAAGGSMGSESELGSAASAGSVPIEGDAPVDLAHEQKLNEAFPDDPLAEGVADTSQPFIAFDPESGEFMLWNPTSYSWETEGPELEETMSLIAEMSEEDKDKVGHKLVQTWTATQPVIQRAGAAKVSKPAAAPADTAEPLPVPDTGAGQSAEAFKIPSPEEIEAGTRGLLFGGKKKAKDEVDEILKKRNLKKKAGETQGA